MPIYRRVFRPGRFVDVFVIVFVLAVIVDVVVVGISEAKENIDRINVITCSCEIRARRGKTGVKVDRESRKSGILQNVNCARFICSTAWHRGRRERKIKS